jgi:hypothetical protein
VHPVPSPDIFPYLCYDVSEQFDIKCSDRKEYIDLRSMFIGFAILEIILSSFAQKLKPEDNFTKLCRDFIEKALTEYD